MQFCVIHIFRCWRLWMMQTWLYKRNDYVVFFFCFLLKFFLIIYLFLFSRLNFIFGYAESETKLIRKNRPLHTNLIFAIIFNRKFQGNWNVYECKKYNHIIHNNFFLLIFAITIIDDWMDHSFIHFNFKTKQKGKKKTKKNCL